MMPPSFQPPDRKPDLYISMIETADVVARRYGVSRDMQDEVLALSQQRPGAAQCAGRFDDEIVPVTTVMSVTDKSSNTVEQCQVTVGTDTCNRPGTTIGMLAQLSPVNGVSCSATAGNASQLSDGGKLFLYARPA